MYCVYKNMNEFSMAHMVDVGKFLHALNDLSVTYWPHAHSILYYWSKMLF